MCKKGASPGFSQDFSRRLLRNIRSGFREVLLLDANTQKTDTATRSGRVRRQRWPERRAVGSLDDSRLLTFIDLAGNVVGVVTHTQPEVEVRATGPKSRAPLGIITLPRIEP